MSYSFPVAPSKIYLAQKWGFTGTVNVHTSGVYVSIRRKSGSWHERLTTHEALPKSAGALALCEGALHITAQRQEKKRKLRMMRWGNGRTGPRSLDFIITYLLSTTMDDISSDPQMSSTNEVPSIATSQCHTLPNGSQECPISRFAALEIPKVPDVLQTALSTAYPLDDTVEQSLLTGLDATRSVSDDIDKCMSAMQAIFEQMRSAKDSCALTIEKYEAALHPIHSLPDDILLVIFHWHVVLELEAHVDYNSISVHSSPLTLSRVCRRWRALTLSSPLLWRNITVHSDYRPPTENLPKFETTVQMWKLLLERSADCDLWIRITGYGPVSDDKLLDELIHFLMPTTIRWKSVEIISTSMSVLAPLNTCSFERLTDLTWRWFPGEMDENVEESDVVSSMFKNAPNISRLTLRGPVGVDLKWEGIREYSCGVHGILNLRYLSAMDRLTLDLTPPTNITGVRYLIAANSIPFSLPNLRSLFMAELCNRFSYIRQVSQPLHLPSLTTLVINAKEEARLPAFTGPLPLLRNLSLTSSASSSEISAFLAAHNRITVLSTGNLYVLRLLRVAQGHTVLLPSLTHLYIDAKMMMDSPKAVVRVLESRCGDDRLGGDVARLEGLTILGADKTRRQARNAMSWNPNLLRRWTALSGKLNVVEMDENVVDPVFLVSKLYDRI